METFVMWCGFTGAWLLFAGPLYQAVQELREEARELARFGGSWKKRKPSSSVSVWWWLLPPVKFVLERMENERYKQALLQTLPDEEISAIMSFTNKALGWAFVASGGLLVALKETYQLSEELAKPVWVFWVIVISLMTFASAYAANGVARRDQVEKRTERNRA